MSPERRLVESAYALSCGLPGGTVEALASAILSCPEGSLRAEVTRRIAHYQHRDLALAFVDRWREEVGELDARTVAVALQTAAHAERAHRDSQSVEPVWTGPDAGVVPFRRTEQAILQVLEAAQTRITLVSFAVYKIPNVADALVKAAGRGVKLTIVLETPDRIEGQGEYSTIRALGREVAGCSAVYYWPAENRPVGENSKVGILHVKCAVADGEWLFLSSANLTRQAFTINMELGTLVRGWEMARRVEHQFDRMIHDGILKKI